MRRPTLQTIADRVGVSRMTVSNAFSRPDQLSAELRDRILASAAELGYVGPDPAARALARGSSGAIGLLLSESPVVSLSDEVATAFLAAVAKELEHPGLALTLISAAQKTGVIPARDVAIDGALVYSCDPRSDAVDWLQRRKLPLVYVDQDPVAGIPSVNVDDRAGARAGADHLLSLGHRNVALVTHGYGGSHGTFDGMPPGFLPHSERERLRGWLERLRAEKASATVIRLPHVHPHDTGRIGGETLLGLDPRPTGVLCFSDAIARGVMDAVSSAGLDVPADISVVGFDDNPLSRRTKPLLTTVRQDIDAKGRTATAALLKAIESDGSDARARHVVLPTELLVRDSTAPPVRA